MQWRGHKRWLTGDWSYIEVTGIAPSPPDGGVPLSLLIIGLQLFPYRLFVGVDAKRIKWGDSRAWCRIGSFTKCEKRSRKEKASEHVITSSEMC